MKDQEKAVYRLGELLVQAKQIDDIVALSKELRPVLQNFPKARTAKIVSIRIISLNIFLNL